MAVNSGGARGARTFGFRKEAEREIDNLLQRAPLDFKSNSWLRYEDVGKCNFLIARQKTLQMNCSTTLKGLAFKTIL